MTAAMETIQLGLDEIERPPVTISLRGTTTKGRGAAELNRLLRPDRPSIRNFKGFPVDHRELRILVPATLSMHWLVPRLPQIEQADLGFRLRVHTTHTGEDWLSLPHDAAIRRDGFLPSGYRQESLFQEELAAYASPILIRDADCEILTDIPLLESRTRPANWIGG
jgi:DNA-binding transcriptional LysR family regulator